MLGDVLIRVAESSGHDAVQQRTKLLNILNRAAAEMYQEIDCNRIRREVSALVTKDMRIALPSMVGELLGVRVHTNDRPLDIEPMAPRFVSDTFGYRYHNWRDLGISPFHTTPTDVNSFTFESTLVESAVVRITGRTNVAAREVEEVTIDESPKESTKLWYPDVKSISSDSERNCDITVKDADGTEIAILYNNERATRYKLVDVSQYFSGPDSIDGQTLVDILYKEPLYYLTLDTDEFPAGSIYDDAWYYKAMSIHYRPMANKKTEANDMRTLAQNTLRNIKDGSERGVVKKLLFGRNKYYNNVEPFWPEEGMRLWR